MFFAGNGPRAAANGGAPFILQDPQFLGICTLSNTKWSLVMSCVKSISLLLGTAMVILVACPSGLARLTRKRHKKIRQPL